MGSYVYGKSAAYANWLETERSLARSVNAIEMTLPKSSREVIASVEDLARQNLEFRHGVREGFDQVCYKLSDISSRLDDLNAAFHWGLADIISYLGHLNDSLQQLLHIARTPAQTWAYEQYEIGRDAIRRQLWPEALVALDRAINGFGTQPGYALDFRFHHARGMIHLGHFGNIDPSMINLAKAEESFLAAGRYARADYPLEAGRCYLSAGWAAYCQGKMSDAIGHTKEACDLHDKLAEAYFQIAKILMHMGEPVRALPALRNAIDLDRMYTMKACSDEDFRAHSATLQDCIAECTREARTRATNAIEVGEIAIDQSARINADLLDARDCPKHSWRLVAAEFIDYPTLCC